MKQLKILFIICFWAVLGSCKKDFLDVVPDNVATIDNAFTNRTEAKKFLYTCYSYLPEEGHPEENPAFCSGDEFWIFWPTRESSNVPYQVARGNQNIVSPFLNFWDGENLGRNLFRALRDCNIFLENIDKVIDLDPFMKTRWVAEVTFLKAYYHWYLLRMYGPIPIIDKNLPITASTDEVKVEREPVDKVVDYIVALIDSAATGDANTGLPNVIADETSELGRITRPIALAVKARVLVTAASPLFNGNADYSGMKKADGTLLFNQTYSIEKWERAAKACKNAIDACTVAGIRLYTFDPGVLTVTPEIKQEMSIRNAVCEKWNKELIWGSSNSTTDWLQREACTRLDPARVVNEATLGQLAPTMKMAELFYTSHGVPINEDKTWDYANRYTVRTALAVDKAYIQESYQTAALHFNREPRFYADMAFDGSQWYMQNGTWKIQCKVGQTQARRASSRYSVTGYFAKKLVNWKLVIQDGQALSIEAYPWPIMRLADLYLLYAEALNEWQGPGATTYQYINLVRERAGLQSIETSWATWSNNPNKYTIKEGLRDIIHQERLIELAFEANRFWDLRRWKEAARVLNNPIQGWDLEQADAVNYTRVKLLYDQHFQAPRDYLWPIKEYNITVNSKLIQNLGW